MHRLAPPKELLASLNFLPENQMFSLRPEHLEAVEVVLENENLVSFNLQ
jgi:hypothetical protein